MPADPARTYIDFMGRPPGRRHTLHRGAQQGQEQDDGPGPPLRSSRGLGMHACTGNQTPVTKESAEAETAGTVVMESPQKPNLVGSRRGRSARPGRGQEGGQAIGRARPGLFRHHL